MIYILYIITVTAVVWFSILASRYIDMIDRSTKLSGAFLGGVLLSAITSLPELFTSISATILIDSPSLCIGNIKAFFKRAYKFGTDFVELTV